MTPLSIFEDVMPAVIQFDGVTPEAIASGISHLLAGASMKGRATQYGLESGAGHFHTVVAQRLKRLQRRYPKIPMSRCYYATSK